MTVKKTFPSSLILTSLLCLSALYALFSLPAYSQPSMDEILFNELLELSEEVNQELLNITALSEHEQNQIGKEVLQEIRKQEVFTKHSRFPIEAIFQSLQTQTKHRQLNYQVHVVQNPEFNAYALIGGTVLVNTGLLEQIGSSAELAFVLGHELAHQDLQHCAQMIQYSALAKSIEPDLAPLVQLAYSLYHLPFNKKDEYAADCYGLQVMQQSGYSKHGAEAFFQRLAKLSPPRREDDFINDFITSHGSAEERLARLQFCH